LRGAYKVLISGYETLLQDAEGVQKEKEEAKEETITKTKVEGEGETGTEGFKLNGQCLKLCSYYSELKPGQSIIAYVEELKIFIETYPYDWVEEALHITINKKNKFIQPYMEKILKNWIIEGKGESNANREDIEQSEKGASYYDSAKLRGEI